MDMVTYAEVGKRHAAYAGAVVLTVLFAGAAGAPAGQFSLGIAPT